MAEKRTIELEIQDNSKSLKAQYKEAVQELQKVQAAYGETSQEAVKAAKAAAELKDQIEFSKDLIDGFNPDTKFNALSGSLSGVLNGFQAVEGAMGMIGVESEALQETMLRVQSVMALTQGIDGLLEAGDAFKKLGAKAMQYSVVQKVVTAGQKLWNLAMSASPIGALIVAITALIAAGYLLVKYFQDQAEETEKATASINEHNKALNKQNQELEKSQTRLEKSNKFQEDYAKASGKSVEEIRKLNIKHAEEELALARKNKELAKATYLREKDILSSLKANDADDEVIKKQEELVKKAGESATEMREIAQKEYNELVDLKKQQRIEIKQEQTNEIKDKKDAAKTSYDAQKQAIDNELKQIKEFNKQAKEQNAARLRTDQENEEYAITEKYKEQIALFKKHGKDTSELEIAQANELNGVRLKYQEEDYKQKEEARQKELDAIKQANDLKKQAEEEFQAQIEQIDESNFQARLQKSMSESDYEKELVRQKYFALEEAAKGNAEQEKIIAEAKGAQLDAINKKYLEKQKHDQQQKVDLILKYAQTFGQAMSSLNGLLNANDEARLKNVKQGSKEEEAIKRKMFERDKKLRIVQTVIDTASNIVQSVRNGGGIPAGIPFGVAAGAMGAMQIAAISKAKFDGGQQQVPDTSAGGGGQMAAPQFNTIGSSGINQLATLQQQPVQAYVVSGEVTSAQSLDRNRVQNATL
jgi:archaellum component FlaF (FlaF/FlaG flagellin family)